MDKYKIKIDWTSRTVTKQVKVAKTHDNNGKPYNMETLQFYKHTHNLEILRETLTGEFEITIDTQGIIEALAHRAARSRGGRSSTFHGAIKAKRLTRIVKEQKTETTPISPGYAEVQEQEGSDARAARGA